MSTAPFHLKYRPKTLDQVIGHEDVVTRIRGIIKSGKIPNAFLITGPSSAGKTTLARCIASELNGQDMTSHPDYLEVDTGSKRTIEEVRDLIKVAKFRPQTKYKIICMDEFQAMLSNAVAAQAMLKAVEEPSAKTIWILCSMDPSKFTSGNGKAIANRCSQIVLEPHTPKELFKQACRIAKGEKLSYLLDEEKTALKAAVKNCNGEMRTLANLVQSLQQYHDGLDKAPKVLDAASVAKVLSTTESSDDRTAVQILAAIYKCQFGEAQRQLLNMQDGFSTISLLLRLNSWFLNNTVLKGARHQKVWPSVSSRAFEAEIKGLEISLGQIAAVNTALVELKGQSQAFAMDAEHIMSAAIYKTILAIKK